MKPKFTVHIPTAREEFHNLLDVLERLPFFLKEGYKVTLPTHPGFKEFVKSSPDLSKMDKKRIWELFVSEIYDPEFFVGAKRALEMEENVINRLFLNLRKFNRHWGVKIYPRYKFMLTAYGSEGKYDTQNGSITIVVGPNGKIKDPHPINTIVHEIIHLGIHENIVKRFKLSHWEKERLVDLICLKGLGKVVPKYSLQEVEDKKIDRYINKEALLALPLAVAQYISDYPRKNSSR